VVLGIGYSVLVLIGNRCKFYISVKAVRFFLISDIVDWFNGFKYGFILYLQNNWTLHVSTIVTSLNYDYNLSDQPFNQ